MNGSVEFEKHMESYYRNKFKKESVEAKPIKIHKKPIKLHKKPRVTKKSGDNTRVVVNLVSHMLVLGMIVALVVALVTRGN